MHVDSERATDPSLQAIASHAGSAQRPPSITQRPQDPPHRAGREGAGTARLEKVSSLRAGSDEALGSQIHVQAEGRCLEVTAAPVPGEGAVCMVLTGDDASMSPCCPLLEPEKRRLEMLSESPTTQEPCVARPGQNRPPPNPLTPDFPYRGSVGAAQQPEQTRSPGLSPEDGGGGDGRISSLAALCLQS